MQMLPCHLVSRKALVVGICIGHWMLDIASLHKELLSELTKDSG